MPDAGHNEAYLLSRAEHYGTQTADTISDLHDTVVGYNLNEFVGWVHAVQDAGDQTVNGVKTLGDRLEMGGNKITTLANPSANCGDAANSAYVDSGSTYVVRTSGNQSVGGVKHFSSAIADSLKRGTGSDAGTNYCTQSRTGSGVSIPNGSWTNFDWNSSVHHVHNDSSSMISGNDFRLPVGGMYILSACLTLPVTPCYWAIQWFQNPYILSQQSRPIFDNDKIELTTCFYFDAGDVVTLRIYQDSAGSLTIPAHSSSTPCWASATLVA